MGALALAAVVVVGVVMLSGGDVGPLGTLVGEDPPETPEFEFEASKPKAVTTAEKSNHQEAVSAAQAPAKAVAQQIDDLYTAAFLDPSNWMEGDYDAVLDHFSKAAEAAAERQLDVLTAGPAASDAFESIQPMPSTLKLQVLFDPSGAPHAVEGSAKFQARGTGADAQVLLISKGQFVFEKSDGEWLIVSFSVQRNDKKREPKPDSSSSPGASASAEPSEAGAS